MNGVHAIVVVTIHTELFVSDAGFCCIAEVEGVLDVVYAIDTASSQTDLRAMKNFVKQAVTPLNVSNADARIGIVAAYQDSPQTLVPFSQGDKPRISLVLDALEPQGAQANILKTVTYIRDGFFKQPSSGRRMANKLMVLLKSGDDQSVDLNLLGDALKALNQSGIKYVIIDIDGRRAHSDMLKRIGDKYGQVFVGSSMNKLPEFLPEVIKAGSRRKGRIILELFLHFFFSSAKLKLCIFKHGYRLLTVCLTFDFSAKGSG